MAQMDPRGDERQDSRREGAASARIMDRLVEEAALESFPASDPPMWTAMHAGPPPSARLQAVDAVLPPFAETRGRITADLRRFGNAAGQRRAEGRIAPVRALTAEVTSRLLDLGLAVTRHPLPSTDGLENVEVVIRGERWPSESVVIAAHDDAGLGLVGADQASGMAALLALAAAASGRRFARTIRFVVFADDMSNGPRGGRLGLASLLGRKHAEGARELRRGSDAYSAMMLKERIDVVAVISIDAVGLLTSRPLTLFGNLASRKLVTRARDAFARGQSAVASHAFVLPGIIPMAGASDVRAFWDHGFAAVLVTDGRPPFARDMDLAAAAPPLDSDRLASLVPGLLGMLADLADGPSLR